MVDERGDARSTLLRGHVRVRVWVGTDCLRGRRRRLEDGVPFVRVRDDVDAVIVRIEDRDAFRVVESASSPAGAPRRPGDFPERGPTDGVGF
ncbi:hypothetical protein C446_04735 [Halobiforma nitratireducens JCM 10879]|uniref:Uncharacterized protein n=1 Tax=Halobiforma nitratireducens JCM 10879 TaxID=1227454 RepID=M0M817_9EURY|nr:hypothetical protein C446_04735 [Halobiforma nitratireducens JCM 10879]